MYAEAIYILYCITINYPLGTHLIGTLTWSRMFILILHNSILPSRKPRNFGKTAILTKAQKQKTLRAGSRDGVNGTGGGSVSCEGESRTVGRPCSITAFS